MPLKFQSDMIIIIPDVAALKLHEILGKTSYCLVNWGTGLLRRHRINQVSKATLKNTFRLHESTKNWLYGSKYNMQSNRLHISLAIYHIRIKSTLEEQTSAASFYCPQAIRELPGNWLRRTCHKYQRNKPGTAWHTTECCLDKSPIRQSKMHNVTKNITHSIKLATRLLWRNVD